MLTLIAAVFVFGLLVMAHEAGHFLAAKRAGVTVYEFSLGFGPRLFKLQAAETTYSVRLLPLGGYVRMAGMEEGDRDVEGSFNRKTVGQRAGVAAAGPLMNLLLAAVLFIMVFTVLGIPQVINDNLVGEVLPDRPAAQAGIVAGDRITAVNGLPTASWQELVEKIRVQGAGPKPVQLELEREGQRLTVEVVPELKGQVPQIGIRPQITYHRLGVLEGIGKGFQQTIALTAAMLLGLFQMFTQGVSSGDLAGPVGITQMIGEAAQGGLANLLYFAGVLSINLAILNLLPIPALDGSRLVFLLFEKLRGRPVEPDREGLIHLIGFALLMALILVLTYQDVMRLFGSGS